MEITNVTIAYYCCKSMFSRKLGYGANEVILII